VFIGQNVKRLQYQDLEHQYGIKRLAAGIAPPLLRRKPDDRLDLGPEALERYDGVKRLKRIAFGADRFQTLVEILESQLPDGVPRLANHLAPTNLIWSACASAIFRAAQ
jgi:hypothetical protein